MAVLVTAGPLQLVNGKRFPDHHTQATDPGMALPGMAAIRCSSRAACFQQMKKYGEALVDCLRAKALDPGSCQVTT